MCECSKGKVEISTTQEQRLRGGCDDSGSPWQSARLCATDIPPLCRDSYNRKASMPDSDEIPEFLS
jgi:hypothetical protein